MAGDRVWVGHTLALVEVARGRPIPFTNQSVVYRWRRSHIHWAVGASGQGNCGSSRHNFDVAEGV